MEIKERLRGFICPEKKDRSSSRDEIEKIEARMKAEISILNAKIDELTKKLNESAKEKKIASKLEDVYSEIDNIYTLISSMRKDLKYKDPTVDKDSFSKMVDFLAGER
jgi:archaellum component FlaC